MVIFRELMRTIAQNNDLCNNSPTMEFAIIQTGGKQYSVSKGDVITIEKLSGTHNEGDSIIFDKVLLWDNGLDTTIGTPYIPKASVKGTITEIGRAAKVLVVRYKQKSRSGWKRNGHRQPFFKVKIDALK
jgi:large subunit ribosomal protein L21